MDGAGRATRVTTQSSFIGYSNAWRRCRILNTTEGRRKALFYGAPRMSAIRPKREVEAHGMTPSLAGLGIIFCTDPALKRWAIVRRP